MKLTRIIERLNLRVCTAEHRLDREVQNGYVSDLLSDVLANCQENDVWITLQVHPNIVAVAAIKGVAAVILVNDRQPQEETLAKARQENLPILVSSLSAFDLAGKLYAILNEPSGAQ